MLESVHVVTNTNHSESVQLHPGACESGGLWCLWMIAWSLETNETVNVVPDGCGLAATKGLQIHANSNVDGIQNVEACCMQFYPQHLWDMLSHWAVYPPCPIWSRLKCQKISAPAENPQSTMRSRLVISCRFYEVIWNCWMIWMKCTMWIDLTEVNRAFLRDPAKNIQEKHTLESTRQHGTILLKNTSTILVVFHNASWNVLKIIENQSVRRNSSGLISCSSTRTKTVMMPTAIPLEM